VADVNRYPHAPFYSPPERSRLSDKLIVIVQAEIDLLRRHRLGGGAVPHFAGRKSLM
jgi:hypothetical protein